MQLSSGLFHTCAAVLPISSNGSMGEFKVCEVHKVEDYYSDYRSVINPGHPNVGIPDDFSDSELFASRRSSHLDFFSLLSRSSERESMIQTLLNEKTKIRE